MRLKECHGAGKQGQLKEYIESRNITIKKLLKWAVGDVERVIYIHPDSYHIFEPQGDDLCRHPMNGNVHHLIGKSCIQWAKDVTMEIIQRDSKPFFWPEGKHETDNPASISDTVKI